MTPSKKSGALPTTTASMSVHRHLGVGEGPLGGLAQQAGQRHVAPGGGVLGLADADDGNSFLAHPARHLPGTQTRFCCRHGPLVAWATPRSAVAGGDAVRHLADADHAGGHHRVGGQGAAGRVDHHVVAQAQGLVAQDELLVAERGVQLGHVDRAVGHAGLGSAAMRADRCPGEVAADSGWASMRWSMPGSTRGAPPRRATFRRRARWRRRRR
jgi:hypothetical protein